MAADEPTAVETWQVIHADCMKILDTAGVPRCDGGYELMLVERVARLVQAYNERREHASADGPSGGPGTTAAQLQP